MSNNTDDNKKHSVIKIGLVCQPKKRKQFFEPFLHFVNNGNFGVQCEFIDVHSDQIRHVEQLPHFDILFLKVTDDMNIEHLDEKARERLSFVRKIIAERPYVLVIERLEAVQRVLDRVVMYSFLHSQLTEKLQTDVVHVPAITILDESVQTIDQIRNQFQRDNVHFPIVCKTVAACGDIKTHNMAMVFTEQQLLQVLKSPEQEIPLPIIAQQYINHDALLYKAYVIGEHVFVQERTSLRNMDPNEPDIIRFNSQYPLPKELLPTNSQEINVAFKNIKPLITDSKLISLFKDISKVLSQALELELFGFDLIKQTETGKYYCVDTNYLPGYSGVEDVHAKLLNHILTKYKQQRELLGI